MGDADSAGPVTECLLDAIEQFLVRRRSLFTILLHTTDTQLAQIEIALRDLQERLAGEVGERGKEPFVDTVGQQQHLGAVFRNTSGGAVRRRGETIGGDA